MLADEERTGTETDLADFRVAEDNQFSRPVVGPHLRTRQTLESRELVFRRKVHFLICICTLSGMLVAGLAPFQSPRNEVHWLANQNGVHLGRHATIWSDGEFQSGAPPSEAIQTLEIWLQADQFHTSGTLLAFSTSDGLTEFSLQQYFSDLILTRQTRQAGNRKVGVGGVFRRQTPTFVTITSDMEQSAVYVDGRLAERFPKFPLDKFIAGRLSIGTPPEGHSDWIGDLLGLALYDRELTPEQVVRHYLTWTRKGRPDINTAESLVVLYLFNEGAGNIIHNASGTGISLNIPERYTPLRRVLFEPFWKEYKTTPSYYKDIIVNVVGFIPLGILFYTYWKIVRPIDRAALATIGVGFAVSLTIEVLQSYLPTRNSGTTDLLTNTLGTYLGVKSYGSRAVRNLIRRVYGCSVE